MSRQLPARPHLDHLRRQAKDLLASLEAGDDGAVRTFQDHLPAARGMTPDEVRGAGFRLADAQSAVARKTGFAGWPQLARHVEQLRALEGIWEFDRLEIDGTTLPAEMSAGSKILIDGDRFRTESMGAVYEGFSTSMWRRTRTGSTSRSSRGRRRGTRIGVCFGWTAIGSRSVST